MRVNLTVSIALLVTPLLAPVCGCSVSPETGPGLHERQETAMLRLMQSRYESAAKACKYVKSVDYVCTHGVNLKPGLLSFFDPLVSQGSLKGEKGWFPGTYCMIMGRDTEANATLCEIRLLYNGVIQRNVFILGWTAKDESWGEMKSVVEDKDGVPESNR